MSEQLDKLLVFDDEHEEELGRKTSKSRVSVVLLHEEDKENQPLDEVTTEDTDVVSPALTKVRKREHRRKQSAPPSPPTLHISEEIHPISCLPEDEDVLASLSDLSLVSLSPSYQVPYSYLLNIQAVVEPQGFVSLYLTHGVVVDISPNLTIRLRNPAQESAFTLTDSTSQLSVVHPVGRMFRYGPRIEIQVEDGVSTKNAKIYPRGTSFTGNNVALVYLLDSAGARTTTDMFHDLYSTRLVTDTMFEESLHRYRARTDHVTDSYSILEESQCWQTDSGVICWTGAGITVQQTQDGLVSVERWLHQGKERVLLKASPSNGRVRVDSSFIQMTASRGEESHMFVKSGDRRLHYSGHTGVMMVRQAGHSAGFDGRGEFRIF